MIGHLRLIVVDNYESPLFTAPVFSQVNRELGMIGGHAVWLFFVLSGLVLTRFASHPKFDYGSYVLSRLARLYIPVWAAVALSSVSILLIPRAANGFGNWIDGHPDTLSINAVIEDLTLLTGVSGHLSPLWTLQWEVLFSLLLVFYIAVLRRLPPLVGIAASIVLIAIGSTSENAFLRYMPMFAIGVCLAFAWDRMRVIAERWGLRRRVLVPHLVAVAGVVLALALNSLPWLLEDLHLPAAIMPSLGMTGSMLGIALLIVLVGFNRPLIRVFESRLAQWLGVISFSIYLVHEPVLIAAMRVGGVSAVSIGIGLALTFVVAAVFARFVEGPAHRYSQNLRRKTAAQVSA